MTFIKDERRTDKDIRIYIKNAYWGGKFNNYMLNGDVFASKDLCKRHIKGEMGAKTIPEALIKYDKLQESKEYWIAARRDFLEWYHSEVTPKEVYEYLRQMEWWKDWLEDLTIYETLRVGELKMWIDGYMGKRSLDMYNKDKWTERRAEFVRWYEYPHKFQLWIKKQPLYKEWKEEVYKLYTDDIGAMIVNGKFKRENPYLSILHSNWLDKFIKLGENYDNFINSIK